MRYIATFLFLIVVAGNATAADSTFYQIKPSPSFLNWPSASYNYIEKPAAQINSLADRTIAKIRQTWSERKSYFNQLMSKLNFVSEASAQYINQFATYRSDGATYFKGTAGYQLTEEQLLNRFDNFSLGRLINNFENNGIVGFGAGRKLKNGQRLEIDYTINQQEFSFVNIGFVF